MASDLQFGLHTFGDVTVDAAGELLPQAQVIRNVVAEAILADEAGIDFFGVGEYHREDFAVSAPDVVLAAIAGQTGRIHLGSAVTVLSSDDPVRVFERFSTLDAVSGGRAELILGRGSFIESFPLFGFSLEQYEQLFAELRKERPVTWSGATRSALTDQKVYPPTASGRLPTWIAVGGSPDSVVRAARYGFPLMLAIIGGKPMQFAPYVDLYHRALAQFGQATQPAGVHSHGYVARTDQRALDESWPHYEAMHARIGSERGWPPMSREQYDAGAGPEGALFVGSPETVAAKIVSTAQDLGLSRFDMKYSAGTLPHEQLMTSIELYGREVIPLVREQLQASASEAASTVQGGP